MFQKLYTRFIISICSYSRINILEIRIDVWFFFFINCLRSDLYDHRKYNEIARTIIRFMMRGTSEAE